jgi:hypothetical protein
MPSAAFWGHFVSTKRFKRPTDHRSGGHPSRGVGIRIAVGLTWFSPITNFLCSTAFPHIHPHDLITRKLVPAGYLSGLKARLLLGFCLRSGG